MDVRCKDIIIKDLRDNLKKKEEELVVTQSRLHCLWKKQELAKLMIRTIKDMDPAVKADLNTLKKIMDNLDQILDQEIVIYIYDIYCKVN